MSHTQYPACCQNPSTSTVAICQRLDLPVALTTAETRLQTTRGAAPWERPLEGIADADWPRLLERDAACDCGDCRIVLTNLARVIGREETRAGRAERRRRGRGEELGRGRNRARAAVRGEHL